MDDPAANPLIEGLEPTFRHLDDPDVTWQQCRRQRNADGTESSVWEKWLAFSPDPPYLSLYAKYDPGMIVRRHGHYSPHIVFVIEGELWVGDRRCPAGTHIELPFGAAFGPLRAGDDGADPVRGDARRSPLVGRPARAVRAGPRRAGRRGAARRRARLPRLARRPAPPLGRADRTAPQPDHRHDPPHRRPRRSDPMTLTADAPAGATPAEQDLPQIISVDDHILEPRTLWQERAARRRPRAGPEGRAREGLARVLGRPLRLHPRRPRRAVVRPLALRRPGAARPGCCTPPPACPRRSSATSRRSTRTSARRPTTRRPAWSTWTPTTSRSRSTTRTRSRGSPARASPSGPTRSSACAASRSTTTG